MQSMISEMILCEMHFQLERYLNETNFGRQNDDKHIDIYINVVSECVYNLYILIYFSFSFTVSIKKKNDKITIIIYIHI